MEESAATLGARNHSSRFSFRSGLTEPGEDHPGDDRSEIQRDRDPPWPTGERGGQMCG